jgi:Protein of unknown function (DUF2934)
MGFQFLLTKPFAVMKALQLTHEQIAERAYQIYLANGCQSGHEKDDWLQAEYELLSRPVRMPARFSKRRFPMAVTVAVINGALVLSQVT